MTTSLSSADRRSSDRRRRVLVVDDDARVRMTIVEALTEAGYQVEQASDGETALAAVAAAPPDLLVLDLSLPGKSGLDVLIDVRRTSDLPVMILTGRGGEVERVMGLDLGADDYVAKPFSPLELAARARSILRRTTRSPAQKITFGELEIDLTAREAKLGKTLIDLTTKEFDLLAFLAANPRQVFSREQLLQHVWSSSSEWQVASTVTQHIHRLRRKLEPDPHRPRWLHAIRGVGYRFDP